MTDSPPSPSSASPPSAVFVEDIEKLIELVEARPALYNKKMKQYSDTNCKKKLWEEICLQILPYWSDLNIENKNKTVKEIQNKWQNLRTCFKRELQKQKEVQSGQASTKRRKYIYFEKLLFLLPTIDHKDTESNLDDSESFDGNDTENSQSQQEPKVSLQKKISSKNKRSEDNFEEKILKALNQDIDEDTNFALSIVPQLKSLDEDDKFEAKIQILQALRKIKKKSKTSSGMQTPSQPPFQPTPSTSKDFQLNNPPINLSHNVDARSAMLDPDGTQDENIMSNFYLKFCENL